MTSDVSTGGRTADGIDVVALADRWSDSARLLLPLFESADPPISRTTLVLNK